MNLTRELYDAFQRVQFDRWDSIIANDVLIKTRAGCDIRGIETLKEFAAQLADLGYRIDLIDEHFALDPQGNGRGFVTFMLSWQHLKDFRGLECTERAGMSEETMLLTIRGRKIVRIHDLTIYEWDHGSHERANDIW
jgi:hypothetical protein